MSEPASSLSIKRFHPRPDARLRLFCFPWAGVGASAFYSWTRHVPAEIELVAIQYPGREDRLGEPAVNRLAPLLEMLLRDVPPHCDRPFAFWGHSMGALLAFELSRAMRSAGLPAPRHLFVSGRQAPQFPEPLPAIPNLPDAAFIVELQQRYGGVPEVIARDAALQALFLPAIRADLELIHTYAYRPGPALEAGISVFGGSEDHVGPAQLEGWREQTSGPFRLYVYPGDHFFITVRAEEILWRVREDLGAVLPQ